MLPTIIYRHRKENLAKCSLRGLENHPDFLFYTYPKESLPDLSNYFLLDMDAPVLTQDDKELGIFLIDGTWNYAKKMCQLTQQPNMQKRSLPIQIHTAYPRKQTKCPDPQRGLSSIEALYVAFHILKKEKDFLFANYYWKDLFLQKNQLALSSL